MDVSRNKTMAETMGARFPLGLRTGSSTKQITPLSLFSLVSLSLSLVQVDYLSEIHLSSAIKTQLRQLKTSQQRHFFRFAVSLWQKTRKVSVIGAL